jgi:hypothetical protein
VKIYVRAANWKLVGITEGRGKKGQEKGRKAKLPLKSIYLYPLTKTKS